MAEKSVLVLDDRGFSRIRASRYLSEGGYEVVEAKTSMDALSRLSGRRFDLAIVSQSLGEMPGVEFLRLAVSMGYVEGSGPTAKPVFILSSEQAEPDLIRAALSEGYVYVISKDLDRDRFLQIIGECIGVTDQQEKADARREALESVLLGGGKVRKPLVSFQQKRLSENSVCFQLTGTLSRGSGFDEFGQAIQTEVRAGCTDVVLDFQEVTYVNSSGIAGLIALLRTCATEKGRLRVVQAQEHVRQVFASLGLLPLFAYSQEFDTEPSTGGRAPD